MWEEKKNSTFHTEVVNSFFEQTFWKKTQKDVKFLKQMNVLGLSDQNQAEPSFNLLQDICLTFYGQYLFHMIVYGHFDIRMFMKYFHYHCIFNYFMFNIWEYFTQTSRFGGACAKTEAHAGLKMGWNLYARVGPDWEHQSCFHCSDF